MSRIGGACRVEDSRERTHRASGDRKPPAEANAEPTGWTTFENGVPVERPQESASGDTYAA